jgi:hypothetical protein
MVSCATSACHKICGFFYGETSPTNSRVLATDQHLSRRVVLVGGLFAGSVVAVALTTNSSSDLVRIAALAASFGAISLGRMILSPMNSFPLVSRSVQLGFRSLSFAGTVGAAIFFGLNPSLIRFGEALLIVLPSQLIQEIPRVLDRRALQIQERDDETFSQIQDHSNGAFSLIDEHADPIFS